MTSKHQEPRACLHSNPLAPPPPPPAFLHFFLECHICILPCVVVLEKRQLLLYSEDYNDSLASRLTPLQYLRCFIALDRDETLTATAFSPNFTQGNVSASTITIDHHHNHPYRNRRRNHAAKLKHQAPKPELFSTQDSTKTMFSSLVTARKKQRAA